MTRFVLCAVFAAFASTAFASPSTCGLGYRLDSYGRGLEAGFRGTALRPKFADDGCYKLGVRDGAALHDVPTTDPGISVCSDDFDAGYADGFKAITRGAGTACTGCYDAGYDAGIAALDVGAREGNKTLVGDGCLGAYGDGKSQGQRDMDETSGGQDNKDNNDPGSAVATGPIDAVQAGQCYRTGYFDVQNGF